MKGVLTVANGAQVVRCGRCKTEFGPTVGTILTVTVGHATFVFDGVYGIRCECGHLNGEPIAPVGEPQDNRCACGKKAGELYPTGVVASSGGRTVWAQRVLRVQCRCAVDWEPRYAPKPFLTVKRPPVHQMAGEKAMMST